MDRLHKVMARAGVASRRVSEELIAAGRVRVNGEIVDQPGRKVDPSSDVIEVDGQQLLPQPAAHYLMLHKPAGYVTSARDPQGRPTVLDLVQSEARVYPVGRLDLDSEGLLLLTNDGDLALRLTHPSFEHEKEYEVLVAGQPGPEMLERLSEGLNLEDGRTWPAHVSRLRPEGRNTWLRWVMHEGRKRQIRRMCERLGHPVLRIVRVRVGPLRLGQLKVGHARKLTPVEVERLLRSTNTTASAEPEPAV